MYVWLSSKESACNARDVGLILDLGRFPGEGNGNPLQYSCLRNSMNRGAWQATVHVVTKESDMTERLNNNNNHYIYIWFTRNRGKEIKYWSFLSTFPFPNIFFSKERRRKRIIQEEEKKRKWSISKLSEFKGYRSDCKVSLNEEILNLNIEQGEGDMKTQRKRMWWVESNGGISWT